MVSEWQDPCLQVLSPVSGEEDSDERVEKTQEACELEGVSSLVKHVLTLSKYLFKFFK